MARKATTKPKNLSKIDETDREILNILAANGREKLTSIAKKVGMSVDATRARILRLEKDGVIKRFTVEVDLEKVGMLFESQVYIKLSNITQKRLDEMIDYLKRNVHVTTVLGVLGDFDVFIVVTGKSTDELTSTRNKIREEFKDIIAGWSEVLVTHFHKLEEYRLPP